MTVSAYFKTLWSGKSKYFAALAVVAAAITAQWWILLAIPVMVAKKTYDHIKKEKTMQTNNQKGGVKQFERDLEAYENEETAIAQAEALFNALPNEKQQKIVACNITDPVERINKAIKDGIITYDMIAIYGLSAFINNATTRMLFEQQQMTAAFQRVAEQMPAVIEGQQRIAGELNSMGQTLDGIKQDTAAMKQDTAAMKQDTAAMKQDTAAMKQDTAAMNRSLDRMLQDNNEIKGMLSELGRQVQQNKQEKMVVNEEGGFRGMVRSNSYR